MVANLKFGAVQTCANPVDLEKRFKQWSYSRYHRRRCSREQASETPVPVNQNRSPVAAVNHLPVIPSKQQAVGRSPPRVRGRLELQFGGGGLASEYRWAVNQEYKKYSSA